MTVIEPDKTVEPSSSAAPAENAKANDAAKLFASEVNSSALDGAVARLETLADAVRLGGDADRAAALTEASVILAADADTHGMPSDDLREIMEHAHAASATMSPMTPEQLADGQAKGMKELTDVPAADLDLARGLIRKLSEKMPTLPYQLEATGLGNRPDFIRAVIREAKRRAGK
ncbi:hypothetical protein IVB14_17675 [Bradyrhizobium sp. 180]|uniref:hypothetical protein n=1 Tax=Bradyrhizobium sp. 180 TaxID=2782650 RepID=UPI001FF8F8C4|nr:hypothetical protein [Bradyrhizobium sp. 180]MCK1492201.1 hypothetical protein [Bradyrhizobium sp. 180]